jgi:hypothetical protein
MIVGTPMKDGVEVRDLISNAVFLIVTHSERSNRVLGGSESFEFAVGFETKKLLEISL